MEPRRPSFSHLHWELCGNMVSIGPITGSQSLPTEMTKSASRKDDIVVWNWASRSWCASLRICFVMEFRIVPRARSLTATRVLQPVNMWKRRRVLGCCSSKTCCRRQRSLASGNTMWPSRWTEGPRRSIRRRALRWPGTILTRQFMWRLW